MVFCWMEKKHFTQLYGVKMGEVCEYLADFYIDFQIVSLLRPCFHLYFQKSSLQSILKLLNGYKDFVSVLPIIGRLPIIMEDSSVSVKLRHCLSFSFLAFKYCYYYLVSPFLCAYVLFGCLKFFYRF